MLETTFKTKSKNSYLKHTDLIHRMLYEIVSGNDRHNSVVGSIIFISQGQMFFIHDTYSISNNNSIKLIDSLPVHSFEDCLFRELTTGDIITITVK